MPNWKSAILLSMLMLPVLIARGDWPNHNQNKWVQLPDLQGLDVLAAQGPVGSVNPLPYILADDFPCRKTGPISDIHIWASWLGDNPNPYMPITLGIWSDVPATNTPTGSTPSHPGVQLWSQTFGPGGGPGQYSVKSWKSGNEQFWIPEPPPQGQILGPDHLVWLYNFYPSQPFVQQGCDTNLVIYWLSVTAGTNTQAFGWKTTTNQWHDDAVFGHVDPVSGMLVGAWTDMHDPRTTGGGKSLDLAFAITTTQMVVNPPPPPPAKWVQYPQQNLGLDVNATLPNIVADDFPCDLAGSITNVQIWASWQNDQPPDTNTTFVLGIWSDAPPGSSTVAGNANNPSHPDQLLWTETFTRGNYSQNFYTNGDELFYDPTSGTLTPETKIWRYSFTPKRPFCQKGSAGHRVIYWLSVYAQPATSGLSFGWKTSTNTWNDDAVYGHLSFLGTTYNVADWKDLHDPRFTNSLSMAFLINNGPPTADCQPIRRVPKFAQYPDPSTNGLDVKATTPLVLGDDFLCRITEPISKITVFGSWLNDNVDSNAVFELGLWTDVQGVPGTATNFSHPGQLLCSNLFYPPQKIATSTLRYNYGLWQNNLQEKFYDPESPAFFIGGDTQIWRYDFYPFYRSCWYQYGSLPSVANIGTTYWLSVTYLGGQSANMFGWKTSTNHWHDDAVWGHTDATFAPLGDWKDLHDPRFGYSLDLSFLLWNFPVTGINKDLKNTTTVTANGIQIVLNGIHELIWVYNDSPPWPNYSVTYSGGQTYVTWSDPSSAKTVAPGQISHVGFEIDGAGAPPIVAINWLSGGAVVGPAVQVCFHFLGNATTLTVQNCLLNTAVLPLNAVAEFYKDPPGLDQMVPNGSRSPISSQSVQLNPQPLPPGGSMRLAIPPGPPDAMYMMLMMNLGDAGGAQATEDFVLIPLDMALRPMIHQMDLAGGIVNLHWYTLPDRIYGIQSSINLGGMWSDVMMGDINGTGEEANVGLPVGGSPMYYRVLLRPE